MAMSTEYMQNFKPFTNGDVPKCVKNYRVGRKITNKEYMSNIALTHFLDNPCDWLISLAFFVPLKNIHP